MRLVCAEFDRYRRFEEENIDLDRRLIAIVGPNEAGKTSLLTALSLADSDGGFPADAFTRGAARPSAGEAVVTLRYILDESEAAKVDEYPLLGSPRWFVVEKTANGKQRFRLEPSLSPNHSSRKETVERISKSLRNTHIKRYLKRFYSPYDGDSGVAKRQLQNVLHDLRGKLQTNRELPEEVGQIMERVQQALETCVRMYKSRLNKHEHTALKSLRDKIQSQHKHEFGQDHLQALIAEYNESRPKLRFFRHQERQLNSQYSYNQIASGIDPALSNLFKLAEIDHTQLLNVWEAEDHGTRVMLEERANKTLREKFDLSWSQSAVYPRFEFGEEAIRILVPTRGTYSSIAERSDGLLAFVALCAFTSLTDEQAPPILLIDEAEAHLHYDAQADLIGVFERQEVAAKIIYSTHSAGALPNDLGTGIRVIEPVAREAEQDTGRSQIRNSFWETGAGFSPLMMAMGASVMALIPTRRALVAEGACETILLPTLFRALEDVEGLDFQVAPGLATVADDSLADLDLEAPVVAYLVDGDEEGKKHERRLERAGIDPSLIVALKKRYVIEDYVDKSTYIAAVNEELRRSHGDGYRIEPHDIATPNRPSEVAIWCSKNGISPPSKVRVARHVVDAARTEHTILQKGQTNSLAATLRKVERILGLS